MGLFDNMLKDHESLFLNPEHLDFDYQPKKLKFRENQQETIARAIVPLLQKRNGKNIFIHGPPGVGKTVSLKHVLQELEETKENIYLIYINCWKKETPHKVILSICEQINYPWTQNKNTEELIQKVAELINKSAAVIVLDEFDKLEDHKILYSLLEELYKKTIIMIANDKNILQEVDARILSRLTPEELAFEPYNPGQIHDILQVRKEYAFVPDVFDEEGFESIVKSTIKTGDLRTGLFLLKESGNHAESRASRKIEKKDVEKALAHVENFTIKKETQFTDGEQEALQLVKTYHGKSARELFDLYRGEKSFRTFQRLLNNLLEARSISSKEEQAEQGGTIRVYYPGGIKTLEEF